MSIAHAPRWLILLIVALAARAITFGNPILHVDEEFYFVTARAMLDGALPFVDIWDRKPVGLFLLYAPAAALGFPAGIWAYQALALACLVATAWLVMRLADRAGWQQGALAAGVATILWPNLIDGQGGQAPIFYDLLVIAAVLLVAPRSDRTMPGRLFARGLGAMALIGLALQLKYSVVFEGAFLGLWLMWSLWRAGARPVRVLLAGSAWAATALAPTALAWAAYAGLGQSEAWLYANFLSILDRNPDPALAQLANLAIIIVILSPLFASAWLGWRGRGKSSAARPLQSFLFAWAGAAILGLLVFGSWFEHYALPLVPPLAICAAGFWGDHRRFALIMLLLAFVGGQAVLLAKRATRGTPGEIAAIARAIGPGPGCLHVYSGSVMLYPMAGRCTVTPWVFPSHLSRVRERGAIGVDQEAEIDRILRQQPEWVVMRKPYIGERPEIRARMATAVKRDYRRVALLPLGKERYALWRRSTPPARSASSSE
ncbi:hypothetical protein FPZ54_13190 [Sphingomonas suaedae]|uniref:Glycosyltransferase RgtA/B/C/D-like domain-containing protein n=1 Tax=Sphingomonas suaedae TaxID=2599297 RepID=A0A518RHC3_9SPHN|nr:hypothetical protein [Sphingomonas suaedae]QDX26867.1 hypothetical protein FPZ54_13190 [Sphingomonas suaedae]